MKTYRLKQRFGNEIDMSKRVNFTFDGKPVGAYQGETIASALYANGVRIFSRSFKYHRPRGLLCVGGKCPNCLMNVDGVPNVRICMETVSNGMIVRHQNAWPSLNHDIMAFLDKLDRFLPVGFYYKSLIRPRWLWHLVEPLIRRIAGLGKIDVDSISSEKYEHLNLHTDLAVIGGGPAGIMAALEAARLGLQVTLIDDQPTLGGHLRTSTKNYDGIFEYTGLSGFDIARKLAQKVTELSNVKLISDATAFGLYEGSLLGILQRRRLIKLRSQRILVATGSFDVPLVFRNNDLPGVFLASGVLRMLHLYGLRPGENALIVTNNDSGYMLAVDLLNSGVKIACVVDSRPEIPKNLNEVQKLISENVPFMASSTIKQAVGSKHVNGAVIGKLSDGDIEESDITFSCDLICVSAGLYPSASLLHQAGGKFTYDRDLGPVPTELDETVYVAGDVTGFHDLNISLLQGKVAGAKAAADLKGTEDRYASITLELEKKEKQFREKRELTFSLTVPYPGKKKFVCFCEDVTEKDLVDAIYEGFEDIEILKRYSTLSMGPCQGKMCLAAGIAICARETGSEIQEIGTTTSRPPAQPVPLGALAGSSYLPVRLSPMDRKHIEMGAKMMDLGQWRRPHSYGSPEEEYEAVRERVGLIDVSTLGKLDIRGKDAARFLDRLYVNTHSNLRIGRTRYGVVCNDSGIILDDGTVSRLEEDHFFITTTTGNVDLVEEWFKWWSAGTRTCVHITNVTAGFASVNLAGPKAREVLDKLTDMDLASSVFPYMGNVQGTVAGVSAIIMRIGFVGEMGWEMHFPAEYGDFMWDALLDAGRDVGISPFGLEAQRILRLEKKHVIIGQDTDATSNPLEGDMAWIVKFDKEEFIGKAGLLEVKRRGYRDRLVGFVIQGGSVAEDGATVVEDGKPIGRVTSSRFSPTLGRGIGIAWVPISVAKDGVAIHIMINGRAIPARVASDPFYDADGNRLR